MKRINYLIVFVFVFFCFYVNVFALDFDVNSDKAILINLNEDSVLYSKNEDEKTYIASLTKIMTAVVVLENVDINDKVVINDEDWKGLIEEDAAVCNYYRYKEYSYLDLLYGLLLPSGADCANSLARNVAGSIDNFVLLMNQKKDELKLSNTHFSNPTGLDDDNNYSTAEDIAILMKYAIRNDTFKKIIATSSYTTYDGITVYNTLNFYSKRNNIAIPNLIGGKTGTTEKALSCIASIASYNDVDYLLVTLNSKSPGQFKDANNIYSYYMNNYSYKNIVDKGDPLIDLNAKYSTVDRVSIKAKEDYSYYLENDFDNALVSLKYEGLNEVSYKMKKGEKLGVLKIYYEKELLDEIDILLDKDMKFSFKKFFLNNVVAFLLGIILILAVFYIALFGKLKNSKRIL